MDNWRIVKELLRCFILVIGIMKRLLLLFMFIPFISIASDEFAAEASIDNPDKISPLVTAYLSKNLSDEIKTCEIKRVEDAFEAKQVKLSAKTNTLLIKPKNFCLCGVYYCPMWLLKVNDKVVKPIWFTEGTNALEILDKKTNGFKHIRAFGSVASHGHESIWAWRGKKYVETDRLIWTWNSKKACRNTETFRLKHGKLKKVQDACITE